MWSIDSVNWSIVNNSDEQENAYLYGYCTVYHLEEWIGIEYIYDTSRFNRDRLFKRNVYYIHNKVIGQNTVTF